MTDLLYGKNVMSNRKNKKKKKPIELEGRGKMPPPGRILDERIIRRKRPTKKDLFKKIDEE